MKTKNKKQKKNKKIDSGVITSWQRYGKNGKSERLYYLRLQNHPRY